LPAPHHAQVRAPGVGIGPQGSHLHDNIGLENLSTAAQTRTPRRVLIFWESSISTGGMFYDHAGAQLPQRLAGARHERNTALTRERFPRHSYGQSHELTSIMESD
jgi:hypothetical protein